MFTRRIPFRFWVNVLSVVMLALVKSCPWRYNPQYVVSPPLYPLCVNVLFSSVTFPRVRRYIPLFLLLVTFVLVMVVFALLGVSMAICMPSCPDPVMLVLFMVMFLT